MVFLDTPTGEDLVERFLRYDVDTAVWLLPESPARQTILRLQDVGIRVLGVSDGGLPSTTCKYEIDRNEAIATILRDWRERLHTQEISIVSDATRRSAADEQRVKHIIDEAKMSSNFVAMSGGEASEQVDSLPQRGRGIIMLGAAATMLAFRNPETLISVMERTPVALIDGPVTLAFTRLADVRFDLVSVDWQLVAQTIVDDLISQEAFAMTGKRYFQAGAKLRVPLAQYCDQLL